MPKKFLYIVSDLIFSILQLLLLYSLYICVFAVLGILLFNQEQEQIDEVNCNTTSTAQPINFFQMLWIIFTISMRYDIESFLLTNNTSMAAVCYVLFVIFLFQFCFLSIIIGVIRNKYVCYRKQNKNKRSTNEIKVSKYLKSCKLPRSYTTFIDVCIVYNAIILASYHQDKSTIFSRFLLLSEYCLLVIFVFDILFRIYSCSSIKAFFLSVDQRVWNTIDFFIVFSSLLSIAFLYLFDIQLLNISYLRVLRLFRLFKILQHNKGLADIIEALKISAKNVFQIFICVLILMLLFAFYGFSSFDCGEDIFNFCTFGTSIMQMFIAATGSNFIKFSIDLETTVFYFLYIFATVYLAFNCLVVVLLESFEQSQLTSNVKKDQDISQLTIIKAIPESKYKKLQYIVESRWFRAIIIMCIIASSIALIIDFDDDLTLILDRFFLSIFIVEAVLKLIVFRSWYFKDIFNVIDFVVVTASLFEVFLSIFIAGSTSFGGAIKVFRVIRPVKVISQSQKVKNLALTLVNALIGVGNVLLLLVLHLTLFSIAAMQIFQGQERQIHPQLFSNFWVSFRTLYETLTLVGWVTKLEYVYTLPDISYVLSGLYFITFLLTGHFLLLKVMIGLIANFFRSNCGKNSAGYEKFLIFDKLVESEKIRLFHISFKSRLCHYTLLCFEVVYVVLVLSFAVQVNCSIPGIVFAPWVLFLVLKMLATIENHNKLFYFSIMLSATILFGIHEYNILLCIVTMMLFRPSNVSILLDRTLLTECKIAIRVLEKIWEVYILITVLFGIFIFTFGAFAKAILGSQTDIFATTGDTFFNLFLIISGKNWVAMIAQENWLVRGFVFVYHFVAVNVFWNVYVAGTIDEYMSVVHIRNLEKQGKLKRYNSLSGLIENQNNFEDALVAKYGLSSLQKGLLKGLKDKYASIELFKRVSRIILGLDAVPAQT